MLNIPGAEEAQAAAAAASEESAETEIPTTETGGEEQEPESTEPDLQTQLDTEREQRIRLEERLAVQTAPPPPVLRHGPLRP